MAVEYTVNQEMQKTLERLLKNPECTELVPLRKANLSFLVAAICKTDKEDQPVATSGDVVVIRRVPKSDAIFMDGDYKIYIDDFRWSECDPKKQEALLHHALSTIVVEDNGEDGIKLSKRKPDVVAFLTTIERFGCWNDPLLQMRERLQAAKKTLAGAKS